jgi:hypothetical protein
MKGQVVVAFLLSLTGSIANAQFRYDYPIVCDSTQKIIESLTINFKETVVWTGKHIEDNSVYSLWINEKTGSWTLLKKNPEVACILGVGEEAKVMLDDQT